MKVLVIWAVSLLFLAVVPRDAEATRRPHDKIREPTTYHLKPQEKVYVWTPPGQWHGPNKNKPINVGAYFDMNGIQGTIQFYQRSQSSDVVITVKLNGLSQYGNEMWGWHIHDFSINWGLLEQNPCSSANIGGHYDPENRSSNPNYRTLCAANDSLCEVGDLGSRHGRLRFSQSSYRFVDTKLNLYGPYSPIGRSVLIHRTYGFRYACANIEYDGENSLETYRATFPCNPYEQSPSFQGEIIMRRSGSRCGVNLEVNLYRVDGGSVNISHDWSIRQSINYVPDGCNSCDDLKFVYGSQTHTKVFPNCGSTTTGQQFQCPIGDLTGKCGPLRYTSGDNIQAICTDTQLGTYPHKATFKNKFIVIQDADGTKLACSKFNLVQPRFAVVRFKNGSVWVNVLLYQFDPHDPTYLRFSIGGLPSNARGFQVRWNSVPSNGSCIGLGPVFEPRFGFVNTPLSPLFINQTGDLDFVGELRYKLTSLRGTSRYSNQQTNSYVPLFGDYSIIGRSFVLLDDNERVLGCGNITDYSNRGSSIRKSFEAYH